MTQRMIIQNEYQELRHKLYIERLERVKWDDKISRNDLEQIKKELEEISNMPREKRRDISREKQNHTLFDSMNALEFDRHENDEKYVLTNSHLFDIDDGIDCYVNQNKIIL
jgi:replicative superfamily II helicase